MKHWKNSLEEAIIYTKISPIYSAYEQSISDTSAFFFFLDKMKNIMLTFCLMMLILTGKGKRLYQNLSYTFCL